MNTTVSLNNKTNIHPILPSTSSLHTGTHVTPVYLNLYDLGGCTNACVHSIGLSFYHCAVQTHLAEYGYMGHPYKFTGVYKTSKHDSRFNLYRLRDSIEVGWTWFSEKEIDKIVNDLKPFYLGCDYDTIQKNSIHFSKYLLEQLSNQSESKHLKSIKILQFPSYIDRGRRLSNTLEFLQMFDTEKEIAEINILYFLYMKYEGNIKQICQILKCDIIDKLKRCIQLIEHGIRQKKLPIFSSFMTFEMKRADEFIHQDNADSLSNNEQLTLTDIFHQFDTITLRGRTSIDRYLNIQRAYEQNRKTIPFNDQQRLELDRDMTLSHKYRSSFPQSISQNQGQTPLTSPSASNISGLEIKSNSSTMIQTTPILMDPFLNFEQLHMRTAIPIGTVLRLQETPDSNLPLTKLHLTTNNDHNSLSFIPNRQWKNSYSSRKRKLPRDLALNSDLYTITNQNSLRHNYTNNAISTVPSFSQCHRSMMNIISFENIKTNEDNDSSV